MSQRHRNQPPQLSLLDPNPHTQLPVSPKWSSLPEQSRQEALALLRELLERHARSVLAGAVSGGGHE